MKEASPLTKIENWLKYRADYAQPVPWIWYLLIALIAGLTVPVFFMIITEGMSSIENAVMVIFFLVIDFLFVYVSIWVLTYFHYRRFMTTRKGLNFFTSKFFRFEQIIVCIAVAFYIYALIMHRNPSSIYLIVMIWTSVMIGLYFLEWIFGGRTSRHIRSFFPRMGKRNSSITYNKRRDAEK